VSAFVVPPWEGAGTTRVEVGPCSCPGEPHGTDWVEVRTILPWRVRVNIAQAPTEGDARLAAYVAGIAAWSFTDPDGEPVPVTPANIELLADPVLEAIAPALGEALARSVAPNASGAPSRRSSRGSAKSPRTTTSTPGSSS
jgi:hypothetical protein